MLSTKMFILAIFAFCILIQPTISQNEISTFEKIDLSKLDLSASNFGNKFIVLNDESMMVVNFKWENKENCKYNVCLQTYDSGYTFKNISVFYVNEKNENVQLELKPNQEDVISLSCYKTMGLGLDFISFPKILLKIVQFSSHL